MGGSPFASLCSLWSFVFSVTTSLNGVAVARPSPCSRALFAFDVGEGGVEAGLGGGEGGAAVGEPGLVGGEGVGGGGEHAGDFGGLRAAEALGSASAKPVACPP